MDARARFSFFVSSFFLVGHTASETSGPSRCVLRSNSISSTLHRLRLDSEQGSYALSLSLLICLDCRENRRKESFSFAFCLAPSKSPSFLLINHESHPSRLDLVGNARSQRKSSCFGHETSVSTQISAGELSTKI